MKKIESQEMGEFDLDASQDEVIRLNNRNKVASEKCPFARSTKSLYEAEFVSSEENYTSNLKCSNSLHHLAEISHSSFSVETTMSFDFSPLSRRSSATTFYSCTSMNTSYHSMCSNPIGTEEPWAELRRRRSVHFSKNPEMTAKWAQRVASERKMYSVARSEDDSYGAGLKSKATFIKPTLSRQISTQTCTESISSLTNIPNFILNKRNTDDFEQEISEVEFTDLNRTDSIIKMEHFSRVVSKKMICSPYKNTSDFEEDVSSCPIVSISKYDSNKAEDVNDPYRDDFDLDTITLSYLKKLKDVVNFWYVDYPINPDMLSHLERMNLVAALYRNSSELTEGIVTPCEEGSRLKLSILEKMPDHSEDTCEISEDVINPFDSVEINDLFSKLVKQKADNYHKNRHEPKIVDGILMKTVSDYSDTCFVLNIINSEDFPIFGKMKVDPNQEQNIKVEAQPRKMKFSWKEAISSSILRRFKNIGNGKTCLKDGNQQGLSFKKIWFEQLE